MAFQGEREHRRARLLPAFLLLLLAEGDRYGAELVAQLEEVVHPWPIDRGAVYRVLRDLEESGQVVSRWEPGEGGPPRRFYQIEPEGLTALARWDEDIAARRRNLAIFARRYRRLPESAGVRKHSRSGAAPGRARKGEGT
ncbi:MAG: PadR family transcriptional regulator [Firmicutes bacterium]|nr:PadR family transcriptional regulator [Bacillota bacterium]